MSIRESVIIAFNLKSKYINKDMYLIGKTGRRMT